MSDVRQGAFTTVRIEMEKSRITKRQLAEATGISERRIGVILRGRSNPRPEEAKVLMDHFGAKDLTFVQGSSAVRDLEKRVIFLVRQSNRLIDTMAQVEVAIRSLSRTIQNSAGIRHAVMKETTR